MKTINGFTYSKTPFEGWKFRAKFEFTLENEKDTVNLDIYTNCIHKLDVECNIAANTTNKVTGVELIHWSSKEEDEWTTKFIEETLKDW